jgi:hypothetical protein
MFFRCAYHAKVMKTFDAVSSSRVLAMGGMGSGPARA